MYILSRLLLLYKLVISLTTLMLLGVLAAPTALAGSDAVLTVSGSSTTHPIIRNAAKMFEAKTRIKIVSTGGGSKNGIANTLKGLSDIGMASRYLTSEEADASSQGLKLQSFTIAQDGNAIIVNSANPIQEVDRATIHKIFTGEITNWKSLNGIDRSIVTIVKEKGRSTRHQFEEYFSLSDTPLKADFIIGSNTEGLVFVGADPDAIGFVSIGATKHAIDMGTGIKMLTVDGAKPTLENVINGSYQFGNRPLNLLTLGLPDRDEQRLIDFIISQQGQKIISDLGYSPIHH